MGLWYWMMWMFWVFLAIVCAMWCGTIADSKGYSRVLFTILGVLLPDLHAHRGLGPADEAEGRRLTQGRDSQPDGGKSHALPPPMCDLCPPTSAGPGSTLRTNGGLECAPYWVVLMVIGSVLLAFLLAGILFANLRFFIWLAIIGLVVWGIYMFVTRPWRYS